MMELTTNRFTRVGVHSLFTHVCVRLPVASQRRPISSFFVLRIVQSKPNLPARVQNVAVCRSVEGRIGQGGRRIYEGPFEDPYRGNLSLGRVSNVGPLSFLQACIFKPSGRL